jgi:uncharacterized protein
MLSAAEQQAFLASIDRVRQRSAGALARAADAEAAVAFVAQLHHALDEVAARAATAGPAPACRAGCAHCCRLPVQATDPELLQLARAVAGWPAAEQAALIARLQAHAPGQSCAFLQDERCTVYAWRPGACRKAHSLSVSACEAGAQTIPQNLAWIVDAEALITGTARAYADAGLAAGAHELNAAMYRTLADPDAAALWFAQRTAA